MCINIKREWRGVNEDICGRNVVAIRLILGLQCTSANNAA